MRLPIIFTACLLMLLSPALFARVINVPDDFDNIQDALDNAAVDAIDTVLLADGVYTGGGNTNLAINRELVLMSSNGAAETTIDCEGAADSRTIFATSSVSIIGLTLRGATANGVRVDNAQRLLIEYCYFIDNNGNVAQQSGGALQLRSCGGTVRNCIFESNTNALSGGAVVTNTSHIIFEGCFFKENHAERFGGAMLITSNSNVSLFNCFFEGNVAGIDGGAVAHSVQSESTISFCTFFENTAQGFGGAIYKGSNSVPTVINSIFWGNVAQNGNQLGEQVPENGGQIRISFCIVEGGPEEGDENGAGAWDGEGLIEDEPQFVDGPEPVWGLNGFYLNQEESPAVDAGSGNADELGVGGLITNPNLHIDTDQADIGFHYWIGWYNIFGRLYGRVLDLADNSPLEGVRVNTSLNQSAITDEEGNWEIVEAYVGLFDVTAELDYYHAVSVVDQELEENEELEVIIRLPHPEFRIAEETLASEIGLEDTVYVPFNLINDGNGPVRWNSYTSLREEDSRAPWESTGSFPVGNEVQDTRIMGVAFDGEDYYLSGADADQPSKIYVLNSEGGLTGEFVQPGSARFGMRDLAWDGELLWGVSDGDVIGFTTAGDSITSFRAAVDPSYNVTYDFEHELYWVSAITSDIYSYDRAGNQVASLDNGPLRIYGLACWPNDPDGASIYVHGNTGEDPRPQVFKIHPDDNGQVRQAANRTFNIPENSSAEGIEFVDGLDPYAITMIAIYNNGVTGDFLDFCRVNLRNDWAQIEPAEGSIEGGESMEVNLRMISEYFEEGVFQAEAHFAFNARGDSLVIPIEMQVVEGDVHAVRTIQLPRGWSLISSHLQPDDADIRTIMQPLLDADKLLFMKDTEGRIYAPRLAEPFINMEPWDVLHPYWVKLNSPGTLRLEGITVRSDLPLQLTRGWNGVAYLPRVVMDPQRAVAGIANVLEAVRDGEGRFMLPRYNFSNLPPCRQGSGYLMRVSQDTEFIWGAEPQNDFAQSPLHIEKTPENFQIPASSGFTMSLLLLAQGFGGVEIAILSGDRIVGGGVISDGKCGISITGDDPETAVVEGAVEGEDLTIANYSWSQLEILSPKLLEGGLKYTSDGITVAELAKVNLPVSALLVEAFPNPFNSFTAVKVSTPSGGEMKLALYDTKGRLVSLVYEGVVVAGEHNFTVDGGSLSSGVYFLKVEVDGTQKTSRLLLMR